MANIRIACPNPSCRVQTHSDEANLGKKGKCQRCGALFTIREYLWGAGALVLGDFLVEGDLGAGAMGVVHLVQSRTTGERYAVKRAQFRDPISRRNFLTELQTWIDLPEYAHLTACRFFRTVGEDIAVFAEFVGGGSLHGAIARRQLATLEQILDAAIQFAWGLHAAHEFGVIHQDVKPANALRTPDGIVKVSDFGLARARNLAGEARALPGQSILVSGGGMTIAYNSPEQVTRQPLSRRTDQWSWAVSVLHMLIGEVTWRDGLEGPAVLEELVNNGGAESMPAPPAELVEVLRRCFRKDPSERWPSLLVVAQQLQTIYQTALGKPYPRTCPPIAQRDIVEPERRGLGNISWADPREPLEFALRALGRDPREADKYFPARTSSRSARAIADLVAYEESLWVVQALVAQGHQHLEAGVATISEEIGLILYALHDVGGAVSSVDRAIAMRKRIVERDGVLQNSSRLAYAHYLRGCILFGRANMNSALKAFDDSIGLLEELVNDYGVTNVLHDLARSYLQKAALLNSDGSAYPAIDIFDKGIKILERLVKRDGQAILIPELASKYLSKGDILWNYKANGKAMESYEQGCALLEGAIKELGMRELEAQLAQGYLAIASRLKPRDKIDGPKALDLTQKALAISHRLYEVEGRAEAAELHARVNRLFARVAPAGQGGSCNAKAAAIYQHLVSKEGRFEFIGALIEATEQQGLDLLDGQDYSGAVLQFNEAMKMRKRASDDGGLAVCAYARSMLLRAMALQKLGESEWARGDARSAIATLEAENAEYAKTRDYGPAYWLACETLRWARAEFR